MQRRNVRAMGLLGMLVCAAVAAGCADAERVAGASEADVSATRMRGPDTPQVFSPGVISDARYQWRITFTPDGRTAYFSASEGFFPVTRQATIYVSHRRGGTWSTPQVAPFSGRYADIDPFVSPNGQRLYFSSIRPVNGVARGDVDLWMVERTRHGWSEPIHLGPEVNSPDADELYPSASGDGTLYFASGPLFPQAGKHFDIYRAARRGRGFAPRQALGAGVNTQPVAGGGLQDAWEFNPEISVDGRTLVFASLRPGGYGLGDLYVSHLRHGQWSAARNLGPVVNTAADEYHPTVSRDRRTLYFVRRAFPDTGDFYHVATSAIGGL
jgi:hypothetical protein